MPTITEMVNEKAPEIKKLALCVPMRGKVDAIFMQSYLALFIHLLKKRGIVAQPIFSDAMPLDRARNQLAKSAVINRADYALWMDADVVMTEAMFERLWETLHTDDKDGNERFVVSGVYYEREIPYDAVIRTKNDLGLYEKIMQFPEDEPFPVDGIGFGFVLMKIKPLREAFNATKGFPFRWTDKVSEDLHFCDILSEGIKDDKGNPIKYTIWCEPRVQVPHYGAYTTQWHYLHYKLDEYHDIQELSRYLKLKSEECYQKCMHGALDMCRAWQDKFGKNTPSEDLKEEDILDFYRETELYLYDLTWFWSHSRQTREGILRILEEKGKKGFGVKVLDFGCGIGDYGLNYAQYNPEAEVHFYDINKHNIAYLKHRIEVREAQGTIRKGKCKIIDAAPEGGEYDIVLAVDVIEHIKDPEKVVAQLRNSLQRNGVLIGKVAGRGAFQPQHISEIDLSDVGFLQTDIYTYVRIDGDLAKAYAKTVDGIKDSLHSQPLKQVGR